MCGVYVSVCVCVWNRSESADKSIATLPKYPIVEEEAKSKEEGTARERNREGETRE